MATYYVDGGPGVTFVADQPLHAGATRKLVQDNLLTVFERGYDHQAHFSGALSDYALLSPAADQEWEEYPLQPVLLPVYPAEGGGFRPVTVSCEAAVSGGTATLRAHLLPSYSVGAVDVDEGIPGATAYAEEAVTAASWTEVVFDPITPDDSCVRWVDCGTVAAGAALPCCYLRFIFQMTDSSKILSVRGVRVREGL